MIINHMTLICGPFVTYGYKEYTFFAMLKKTTLWFLWFQVAWNTLTKYLQGSSETVKSVIQSRNKDICLQSKSCGFWKVQLLLWRQIVSIYSLFCPFSSFTAILLVVSKCLQTCLHLPCKLWATPIIFWQPVLPSDSKQPPGTTWQPVRECTFSLCSCGCVTSAMADNSWAVCT